MKKFLPPIETDTFTTVNQDLSDNMTQVLSPMALKNRLFEQVSDVSSRESSPDHIHFTANGRRRSSESRNGYRVIRSATVGYVAPRFEGKTEQKEQGEDITYNRVPS